MLISHNRYMALQSLIVLHLSKVECEIAQGLDWDNLINWYLESKEDRCTYPNVECPCEPKQL